MPPRRLIEGRDAHQPVHADFGGQQTERVLADDDERRALEARFVAGLIVDQLALEAAALRPSQVHPEQHLGPVLRLGAAGAGMNRDDRVLAIVLAAEHLLDLAGLHFLIERLERLRELRVHRLAGLRPLDEHAEVVALLLERQRSDRDPARAGGGAAGPSVLRPGLSRNRRRRTRVELGLVLLSGLAASKIAPKIGGSPGEILIAAHQVVDGGHGVIVTDSGLAARGSRLQSCDSAARRAINKSATVRLADAYANTSPTREYGVLDRQQPHLADDDRRTEDLGLRQHVAVRIDDAAHAGVGARGRDTGPLRSRASTPARNADTARTIGRTTNRW